MISIILNRKYLKIHYNKNSKRKQKRRMSDNFDKNVKTNVCWFMEIKKILAKMKKEYTILIFFDSDGT